MAELLQVPVDDYTFNMFRQQAQSAGLSVADYLRRLAEQQGKRRFLDVYPAELSPEAEAQLDKEYEELMEKRRAGTADRGERGFDSVAEMMKELES